MFTNQFTVQIDFIEIDELYFNTIYNGVNDSGGNIGLFKFKITHIGAEIRNRRYTPA